MVKLFVVLGFALLAGGAYAIIDGWPYLVLERGFTEVILGALAATAGLILLALAAVLAEVRRLKAVVSGAMAVATLAEPRLGEQPAAGAAAVGAEPVLKTKPALEAGHIGIATTLAAGAGAAAVAGALTGFAKAGDEPGEKTADEKSEPERLDGDERAASEPAVTAAEPSRPPSAAAGETDDWLLPPVSPVLDAAPADIRPDERDESGEADETTGILENDGDRPILAGADEVSRPDGEGDEAAPAVAPVDEAAAEQPDDEREAAEEETASASPSEDRLWWPRIDRPAREEAGPVDDEFNALRDQLSGVVNAPEVEPPRRDRDVPAGAESWMAPRPWPPVTQPRDPGALSETEAEPIDKASQEEAKAEPAPVGHEPAHLEAESELPEEKTSEPASAEAEASAEISGSSTEAKPDEERAASEEGVIGAYQVGETQFTMFADGSIHARTPDGDYTFASMDELKAYLASEKSRLEPSSN